MITALCFEESNLKIFAIAIRSLYFEITFNVYIFPLIIFICILIVFPLKPPSLSSFALCLILLSSLSLSPSLPSFPLFMRIFCLLFLTLTRSKYSAPSNKGASTSGKSTQPADAKPKPARKEDCVFEATAANFQQLVLESKVPVLVDIYADWCGPCKQLGPMLESAAMKSGK